MKAIAQDIHGSPGDVLELRDIGIPVISDDDVLVRVGAAAVNPPDWAGVTEVPYIARVATGLRKPRNGVRGSDMAGSGGRHERGGLLEGDGGRSAHQVGSRRDSVFGEGARARPENLVPDPQILHGTWSDRSASTTSSTTRRKTSPRAISGTTSSSTTCSTIRWAGC